MSALDCWLIVVGLPGLVWAAFCIDARAERAHWDWRDSQDQR